MSKRFYFITGLPRSRTAWFANYLTWGDSFCRHDAFHTQNSFDAFCDMLEATPVQHVGHADPANVFLWRRLRDRFPEAQWVIVQRNLEDAIEASCNAFGVGPNALGYMSTELGELAKAVNPLIVDFENPRPHEVAAYLGIDAGGDERRLMLERLNVQLDKAWLCYTVRTLAPDHWLFEVAA